MTLMYALIVLGMKKMSNKLKEFQKSYEDAVEAIKTFSEPTMYNPPMDGLVRWMLETEANPYGYLPNNGSSLSSAESFAGLLYSISHALYDDGDITFVSVNGEPRIVFAHKSEDNIRSMALSPVEQERECGVNSPYSWYPAEYEIKILDIEPNQFGQLYDEYTTKLHKEWEDLEDILEKLR